MITAEADIRALLLGKRISGKIAAKVYAEFQSAGTISPEKISNAGWNELVRLLGRGGYRRYEFKAADKLLGVSNTLLQDYAGDLNVLHCLAADGPDLERQIKRLGKGVGDVTVNIFLREMRTIWPKAQPLASKTNGSGCQSIGLIANDLGDGRAVLEALKAAEKEDGRKPEDFPAFEAAPVRYGLATRKRAYVPCTAACFRLSLISTKGKLSGFLWMPHNKKNWQFARSMRAGRRAAVVMSLLHSARLNSHDVRASMKDVLERLPTLPASHISDVVPHRWTQA